MLLPVKLFRGCSATAAHRVPFCSPPWCSMEFVAAQFPASSTLLKAHVNFRSAPYLPDLVAIVFQMLHIDEERRRRSLVQLPEFRCGAVAAGAAVQE